MADVSLSKMGAMNAIIGAISGGIANCFMFWPGAIVAVRYKQTIVGAAWALIRPFLTMVVFTVIFSRIAKLPTDGITPYPLMVFVGTLPWTFFSTGLTDASNSLIGNANLISKIYFPRLIVPIAAVVVAFADFLIAFAILIGNDGLVSVPAPAGMILLLPAFVAFSRLQRRSVRRCGSRR